MAEGSQLHTAGALVWVQQSGRWCQGQVISADGSTVQLAMKDNPCLHVSADQVFLQNQQGMNADDMTTLTHLHEPGVLHNLGERYCMDRIYTNTGSILIAVNPFKRIKALVESSVMEAYQARLWQDRQSDLPPHVYGTAVQAFKQMLRDKAGQAILITGESGAGKTETCKLIMRCLAHLGSHHAAASQPAAAALSRQYSMAGFSIEQKVLESNPLLEAFGNAKTSRNDNSSRFGKYVEIQFDRYGQLVGAAVRTYLLERSRVVHIVTGERSFHAFYQMCAGASAAERAAWHLGRSTDYALLCQSDCHQLPGTDDGEEYQVTRHAMTCVGISDSDQQAVYATLAAILHLGNVKWAEAHAAAACPDHLAATFPPASADLEVPLPADEASWVAMAWAAELLQVPGAQLLAALNTRTRQTPDGPIVSPLSAAGAEDARNALSKVIYARVFGWIVSCVNASLAQHHTSRSNSRSGGLDQAGEADGANGFGSPGGNGNDSEGGAGLGSSHTIGLLDIYGFESFQVNDLEQLCINLANEKLQQHFNQHVFKWEQAEYTREGVDWRYINFVDNQDVLDLVEGKFGLLDLLDEQSRFPTATAADLAYKYGASQTISASKRFEKLKRPPTGFAIEHYAGPVTYTTDNFLDKNRDYVVAEHASLLGASTCNLMATLFGSAADTPSNGMTPSASSASLASRGMPAASPPVNSASKSAFKFDSVSSQFKRQLADLMAALHIMQPHYVRCIKPNAGNKPGVFDQAYVLNQLRCGGVMEAVRISCAGFSYKRPYAAFLDYFWPLCPSAWHSVRHLVHKQQQQDVSSTPNGHSLSKADESALKEAAKQVLNAAGLTQFHLGHTKLFLKAQQAANLDKQRNAAFSGAATRIQAVWKGVLARRQYAAAQAAAVLLQSMVRAWAARQCAERLRRERAATWLQAFWRSRAAQQQLQQCRQAAEMLQGYWRGRAARLAMEEHYRAKAAVTLQSAWRARPPRLAYSEVLPYVRAAVHIQRAWRSSRRGVQLQEAFREAVYAMLHMSRAAVVIQSAYRAQAARRQAANIRQNSKRKQFKEQLQRFQAPAGASGPAVVSPGSRGLSAVKTAGSGVSRSGSMDRGSPRAYISPRTSVNRQTLLDVHGQRDAHKGTPVDAVRELDTIANNSADARREARLKELGDYKISSLLNMWKGMEAAAPTPSRGAGSAVPTSNGSAKVTSWEGQSSTGSPRSVQSYGQLLNEPK